MKKKDEKSEFFEQFRNADELSSHLQGLFKEGVQHLLEGELDEHLGYDKYATSGRNSGNSRNGKTKKKVKTQLGEVELEVPRDREGSFEPKLVPKGSRVMEAVEDKVIGLYAKGMSVRDIADQIEELYGVTLSDSSVSNITNKLLPVIEQWRDRPLSRVYLMLWMDGMVFKVRQEGRVVNKCLHLIIGLNLEGRKEVLGMWISQNESSTFWLGVLSDIKQRGVEDVLIVSTDNLKGLSDAIVASFPQAVTQVCVVHQVRNCLRYVPWKDKSAVAKALKDIYNAPTIEIAESAMAAFEEEWGKKYPYAVKSWLSNWRALTACFGFPPEIRNLMYTTNTIESLNSSIRKFTRNKTILPSDNAVFKAVYLAVQRISRHWSQRIHNWPMINAQFKIMFEERLQDG